jgi:hypothetical protein
MPFESPCFGHARERALIFYFQPKAIIWSRKEVISNVARVHL